MEIEMKYFSNSQIVSIADNLYNWISNPGDDPFSKATEIMVLRAALTGVQYEWDTEKKRLIRTFDLYDRLVKKVEEILKMEKNDAEKALSKAAFAYIAPFYMATTRTRTYAGIHLTTCLNSRCADIIFGNAVREAFV